MPRNFFETEAKVMTMLLLAPIVVGVAVGVVFVAHSSCAPQSSSECPPPATSPADNPILADPPSHLVPPGAQAEGAIPDLAGAPSFEPSADVPTATLSLMSSRGGCLVVVGGCAVGVAPIFLKAVPVGRQLVQLRCPDGHRWSQTYDFVAGEKHKILLLKDDEW